MKTTVLAIFVTLYLCQSGHSEVFTALIHMEGLLELERDLLHGLNVYINSERQRLLHLERFSDRVEKALEAVSDVSQHLHDPVNAFQMMNRYTNGWMKLHENVYAENGQDLMANVSQNRYQFPTVEDFDGAVAAIIRLQDTYNLEPSTIAKGKLSPNGLSMTSDDCFTIGRYAYNLKDWRHTRGWMLTALEKFDEENGTALLDVPSVYDHLSFSEYSIGNIKKAAHYTRELLQHDSYHERAIGNKEYFDRLSSEQPDKFVDDEQEEVVDSENEKYEKVCREAPPIPSHLHKHLICYYFDNNRNPGLIIRPIKSEVAFLEPKIYIFHDFVSDQEMDRLKELANPKMRRATARNSLTGQFEPVAYRISKRGSQRKLVSCENNSWIPNSCIKWSNVLIHKTGLCRLNRATVHGTNGQLVAAAYRISKSGWLSADDDPLGYVSRIDQRIEDTTGLDMTTAEQLQVVNYGIGGHYEPHYDFARTGEDPFSSLGSGNRIATLLIYMSDVELGGATVFSLVGARISPKKGSALYWWNLKKSGEGDYSTRHAGCPVLVGSKWVCNKWIHERGQEFRRPCGLSPDE